MKRKRQGDSLEPDRTKVIQVEASALKVSIPGVFIANSKSQEGKSHLIKYLAYENQDKIDYAIAISRTAFDDNNLPFIPKRFKFTTWPGKRTKEAPEGKTKKAVLNLIEQQMKIPAERRPTGAIFIEDEFNSLRDNLIIEIAQRPYHYKIWLVICTNWVNKVAPDIREGAWQVALFKMTSKKSIAAAYDSYGEDCWDLSTFHTKLSSSTGDYRFLYKDLKGDMKWYCFRAPSDVPPFMIDPNVVDEDSEGE